MYRMVVRRVEVPVEGSKHYHVRSRGSHVTNDRAEVPQGIVYRYQPCSVLRVRKFRDEHWRAALGIDYAESDDKAGGDEHSNADANGLQDHAEKYQRASKEDRPLATNVVGEVGN